MTKLEFANKFFFQLFFVRLTRCIDKGINMQWYSIMYFVIPFTGWDSKFKFITKMNLKRITKKYRNG